MDPQVIRAMAKWPGVPAVFGWLRLDRRGNWLLVDRGSPQFDEARDAAGSTISNEQIVDFIGRNYAADQEGRWYWQNGPQRVYVDLDAAPLVLRVLGPHGAPRFVAHTGEPVASVDAAWSGPAGEVLLSTNLGPAVVHDLDLAMLQWDEDNGSILLRLGERQLPLRPTDSPPRTMGYVAVPRPPGTG